MLAYSSLLLGASDLGDSHLQTALAQEQGALETGKELEEKQKDADRIDQLPEEQQAARKEEREKLQDEIDALEAQKEAYEAGAKESLRRAAQVKDAGELGDSVAAKSKELQAAEAKANDLTKQHHDLVRSQHPDNPDLNPSDKAAWDSALGDTNATPEGKQSLSELSGALDERSALRSELAELKTEASSGAGAPLEQAGTNFREAGARLLEGDFSGAGQETLSALSDVQTAATYGQVASVADASLTADYSTATASTPAAVTPTSATTSAAAPSSTAAVPSPGVSADGQSFTNASGQTFNKVGEIGISGGGTASYYSNDGSSGYRVTSSGDVFQYTGRVGDANLGTSVGGSSSIGTISDSNAFVARPTNNLSGTPGLGAAWQPGAAVPTGSNVAPSGSTAPSRLSAVQPDVIRLTPDSISPRNRPVTTSLQPFPTCRQDANGNLFGCNGF